MSDNQTNQMPPVDLNKCSDCKKPFSLGQEYWSLIYEGKAVMNSCLPCWAKYTPEKKKWEK